MKHYIDRDGVADLFADLFVDADGKLEAELIHLWRKIKAMPSFRLEDGEAPGVLEETAAQEEEDDEDQSD